VQATTRSLQPLAVACTSQHCVLLTMRSRSWSSGSPSRRRMENEVTTSPPNHNLIKLKTRIGFAVIFRGKIFRNRHAHKSRRCEVNEREFVNCNWSRERPQRGMFAIDRCVVDPFVCNGSRILILNARLILKLFVRSAGDCPGLVLDRAHRNWLSGILLLGHICALFKREH
jgi:hypothetical protein